MTEYTVGSTISPESDTPTASAGDWDTPAPQFSYAGHWERPASDREVLRWHEDWRSVGVTGGADDVWHPRDSHGRPLALADTPATGETKGGESVPATPEGDPRAARANEIRLELLARRYAREQLSPEEQARFDIVTAMVRALLPTVTREDFDFLDAMDAERQRRDATLEATMRDLGLE